MPCGLDLEGDARRRAKLVATLKLDCAYPRSALEPPLCVTESMEVLAATPLRLEGVSISFMYDSRMVHLFSLRLELLKGLDLVANLEEEWHQFIPLVSRELRDRSLERVLLMEVVDRDGGVIAYHHTTLLPPVPGEQLPIPEVFSDIGAQLTWVPGREPVWSRLSSCRSRLSGLKYRVLLIDKEEGHVDTLTEWQSTLWMPGGELLADRWFAPFPCRVWFKANYTCSEVDGVRISLQPIVGRPRQPGEAEEQNEGDDEWDLDRLWKADEYFRFSGAADALIYIDLAAAGTLRKRCDVLLRCLREDDDDEEGEEEYGDWDGEGSEGASQSGSEDEEEDDYDPEWDKGTLLQYFKRARKTRTA